MPRGDRTGSWGQGPMTGKAAGYCAGYSIPGYINPVPSYGIRRGFRRWGRGRGRGFGRGLGRGFWRGWWIPPTHQYSYPPIAQPQSPEQEVAALENYRKDLEAEKADLEREMGEIISRIEELRAKLEGTEKE